MILKYLDLFEYTIRTKFAVVGNNSLVACREIKLFALLLEVYPQDFVDFLLWNYLRFLDDIFHKWLENFDIKQFYDLINSLDEDLKLLLENQNRNLNFQDIPLKIVNNMLSLSLAKRIINIVTNNRETRLSELKKHLIERNHPPEIIDYAFTKCFPPKLDKNWDLEKIVFARIFNPNHVIKLNKLTGSLEDIRSNELKQCF